MFTSYIFVAFFLSVLILYYLLPKRFQWIFLLAANFLFYYRAGSVYPVFILITGTVVYLSAVCIDKCDGNVGKKLILTGCLLINLGILAVVKYTGFILDNIQGILDVFHKNADIEVDFIVPMGISFYTFQAVGYLLDVYWGKCKVQKNLFRFLLFISFFPQLVQGPISRYNHLSESLYKEHFFDWERIKSGAWRILWGYFKKLVVADRIGIAVSVMVREPQEYQGIYVIIYMLFYAVQLYADFTGGIDISIGMAECMGISLRENFIRPYFSKSIAEYWRRWHISMGTWFRDYVFYPCGMSRPIKKLTSLSRKYFGMRMAKRVAVYAATMTTWFATGIWHGAAWSYVVWGLVNGVVILLSEEFTPWYEKFHKAFPRLANTSGYRMFQVLRTFALMCCIRMFDNYNSVRTSIRQFFSIFTVRNLPDMGGSAFAALGLKKEEYIIVLSGVAVMFMVSLAGRRGSVREKIKTKPYIVQYGLFMLLLFSVLLFGTYGVGYDAAQFIYNQF